MHSPSAAEIITWLCVKNTYPKWNPGKWNQRLQPAVAWWVNFDPHPHVSHSVVRCQGKWLGVRSFWASPGFGGGGCLRLLTLGYKPEARSSSKRPGPQVATCQRSEVGSRKSAGLSQSTGTRPPQEVPSFCEAPVGGPGVLRDLER